MASPSSSSQRAASRGNPSSGGIAHRDVTPSALGSTSRTPGARAKVPATEHEHQQGSFAAPMCMEMHRLEDNIKVKDMELGKVTAELKAVRQTNVSMEKAISQLSDETQKLKERLLLAEEQVESKTLELKKTEEVRRAALSDLSAAEGTVRRLHAAQKDSSSPDLGHAISSLEAELKLAQREIAKLQEDTKAQERLTRTKEAALIQAEKDIATAEEKLSQVDEIQNKVVELTRQFETVQEENKTLDKMYKQKIEEVKKLTAQTAQLSEALLEKGASDSVIKDYARQLHEHQAEQRKLNEELARAKVAATRVAMAVANEWKDDNDKVISVKQWLEERRVMQGEIDKLKEKLGLSERACKYEGQMKVKAQTRLKVIEDSLKTMSVKGTAGGRTVLPVSSLRTGRFSSAKVVADLADDPQSASEANGAVGVDGEAVAHEAESDYVPEVLYDTLQREVVMLRKTLKEREQSLKEKEEAIEMLTKKAETLTRAMDVEGKKSKREITSLQRDVASLMAELQAKGVRRASAGLTRTSGAPAHPPR